MEGNHTFIPHYATGRGNPSLSRLFESIGRNEEGRPSPLRLWVLFDAMRGETLPICLTLFDATRRGDPPRRVPLMFFDATRHRTPGVCPFGRTLGVRALSI